MIQLTLPLFHPSSLILHPYGYPPTSDALHGARGWLSFSLAARVFLAVSAEQAPQRGKHLRSDLLGSDLFVVLRQLENRLVNLLCDFAQLHRDARAVRLLARRSGLGLDRHAQGFVYPDYRLRREPATLALARRRYLILRRRPAVDDLRAELFVVSAGVGFVDQLVGREVRREIARCGRDISGRAGLYFGVQLL